MLFLFGGGGGIQMCVLRVAVMFESKGSGEAPFPWEALCFPPHRISMGKKASLWAFFRDFLPGFAQAVSIFFSLIFFFFCIPF